MLSQCVIERPTWLGWTQSLMLLGLKHAAGKVYGGRYIVSVGSTGGTPDRPTDVHPDFRHAYRPFTGVYG